jgi:hypothetical protein
VDRRSVSRMSDAEARLHANPELLARIESAEKHPERRVPRPETKPQPAPSPEKGTDR